MAGSQIFRSSSAVAGSSILSCQSCDGQASLPAQLLDLVPEGALALFDKRLKGLGQDELHQVVGRVVAARSLAREDIRLNRDVRRRASPRIPEAAHRSSQAAAPRGCGS